MKKYSLLAFLVILIFLTTHCTKVDCLRYCRELTEEEKQFTPYKQNDLILLTNKIDTFSIRCISYDYSQKKDIYADHYYFAKCDGGRETYYWELTTKFITDLNYTDSTLLDIEINTITNYPFDEGVFSLRLFDNGWCSYDEEYEFFTRRNNSTRLFKARTSNPNLPPKYNQCDLMFYDEIRIEGYFYKNVNVLYGDIKNFDTVYYNSEFGIIRTVNDTIKLNILR